MSGVMKIVNLHLRVAPLLNTASIDLNINCHLRYSRLLMSLRPPTYDLCFEIRRSLRAYPLCS